MGLDVGGMAIVHGATLFAVRSGRLVPEADGAADIAVCAATQPRPPIASVARDVPPELAAVVDRALAFRREETAPYVTDPITGETIAEGPATARGQGNAIVAIALVAAATIAASQGSGGSVTAAPSAGGAIPWCPRAPEAKRR